MGSTYHCSVGPDQLRTRSVPGSVSGVLQELELRQPAVVTRALLTEIVSQLDTNLTGDEVIERLVRLGWLLPLRKRGAWEFAPAARAGRYPSGDPWIELRALLEQEPDSPVAVAFDSAVWERGHAAHPPTRPVLAHRRGWRAPEALKVRLVTFEWHLAVGVIRGLPVWKEATMLVAAAERPAAQGNWANVEDWLVETFRVVTADEVLAEADGRKVSTVARLGYLAEWSGRDDVADEIEALLPGRLPVTSLGPRDQRDRWSRRWRVYDGLLPSRWWRDDHPGLPLPTFPGPARDGRCRPARCRPGLCAQTPA